MTDLLTTPDPEQTIAALRDLEDGALIERLSRDVPAALEGSEEAARRYVADSRRLTTELFREASALRPDLFVLHGNGSSPTVGERAGALLAVMDTAPAEAPFTSWATVCDSGVAAALHITNTMRRSIGAHVLDEPPAKTLPAVSPLDAVRFTRRVRSLLNQPDTENPLRRIMRSLGLSKTETARLFRVTRQAIDGWLEQGVPAERQEKVTALLALCDLLERKLKADRLPGIARRPADAYGGQTMLELIEQDRHGELLASVRASFDWQTAA